ncbi:hypothetical protein HFM15_001582 [Vibrio cholerae]|nr:hypothetical protein [Vibrio cholerae]
MKKSITVSIDDIETKIINLGDTTEVWTASLRILAKAISKAFELNTLSFLDVLKIVNPKEVHTKSLENDELQSVLKSTIAGYSENYNAQFEYQFSLRIVHLPLIWNECTIR